MDWYAAIMDWHATIMGWHTVIILLIFLDVFLPLLGFYLSETASSEIEKYMPFEFSRNGTYRWYIHHFAFDVQVPIKYRYMYITSVYIGHLFIFMSALTLFIINKMVPAAIFLFMSIASIFGLVKYTKEFLASIKAEPPTKM